MVRIIVAAITFALWVASVVAFLFFRVPIDQGVFILTMAVFAFLFGPGVFKSVRGSLNGKGNGAR